MQGEVENTILKELRDFRAEEEIRWRANIKTLSDLEKERKENSNVMLSLRIEIGALEGKTDERKTDDLKNVIAENTAQMFNIKGKTENLEKTIEKLKETQEENEICDFNSIKNFEREQLISNLILKVWNLTERVKALEK